jgi:pimeloyl-ACP methyl ester carboxylesterase
MNRRQLLSAIVLISTTVFGAAAQAAERVGVLMLHGESAGTADDPLFSRLKYRFQKEGMLVRIPDMPWSSTRYLDGNWSQAMAETAAHVAALRKDGATRIVLIGHGMGCPAVLGFAARKGDVQEFVLLAPSHIPSEFYSASPFKTVHDSVEEARSLVKLGRGADRKSFAAINLGKPQVINISAENYLSYFDPTSDAEMSVTAPKIPSSTATLVVIGDRDPLIKSARAYLVDKLPANPKSSYLEVSANHLSTPAVAADAVVEWIKKTVAN